MRVIAHHHTGPLRRDVFHAVELVVKRQVLAGQPEEVLLRPRRPIRHNGIVSAVKVGETEPVLDTVAQKAREAAGDGGQLLDVHDFSLLGGHTLRCTLRGRG